MTLAMSKWTHARSEISYTIRFVYRLDPTKLNPILNGFDPLASTITA